MAWFRIRELLWNSLDTGWKLRIVAVRKDSQLPEGLIFGTSEILFLMANGKAYEVDRLNYQSISGYLPTCCSSASTCYFSFSD